MCCFFFAHSLSVSHHSSLLFASKSSLSPTLPLSVSGSNCECGTPTNNTQHLSGFENVHISNAPGHRASPQAVLFN